jgi:hypothetical protein
MEKPNLVGWAAKSRLRRVDLPVPEGPQTTRGCNDERRMGEPRGSVKRNDVDSTHTIHDAFECRNKGSNLNRKRDERIPGQRSILAIASERVERNRVERSYG